MQLSIVKLTALIVLLLAVSAAAKSTVQAECVAVKSLLDARCCIVHELYPHMEFSAKCAAENAHLNISMHTNGGQACHWKCIAESSGTISGHTFNVEKLHKYASRFNEAIARAYRTAIDQCIATMPRPNFNPATSSWKCDPFALNFDNCVYGMLVLTCPNEFTKDAEICRKFRARVPLCKTAEQVL